MEEVMEYQYQNHEICLYFLGYEKDRARGVKPDFLIPECQSCHPDKQTAIICPHYYNQEHLENFRKRFW